MHGTSAERITTSTGGIAPALRGGATSMTLRASRAPGGVSALPELLAGSVLPIAPPDRPRAKLSERSALRAAHLVFRWG